MITFLDEMLIIFVEIFSLGGVIYHSFWHSEQHYESRAEAGFKV